MSADNGVYILSTIRHRKQEGHNWVKCDPYIVYRVSYVQTVDTFQWYKENENYNLGAYMKDTWGTSKVYIDKLEAVVAAHKIADTLVGLEYGVSFIETDLKFYGDL
jgi:hypothetical protein